MFGLAVALAFAHETTCGDHHERGGGKGRHGEGGEDHPYAEVVGEDAEEDSPAGEAERSGAACDAVLQSRDFVAPREHPRVDHPRQRGHRDGVDDRREDEQRKRIDNEGHREERRGTDRDRRGDQPPRRRDAVADRAENGVGGERRAEDDRHDETRLGGGVAVGAQPRHEERLEADDRSPEEELNDREAAGLPRRRRVVWCGTCSGCHRYIGL